MNVYAILCLSALCGCARMFPETREVLIDYHGVSSRMLVVNAGTDVRFVNRDRQPHHIHSQDCAELSSRILYPYDAHTAQIGAGPKVCHFQDLLTPPAAGYSGTLQVRDDREKRGLGASQ
jgi:hypothetical protein